MKLTLLVLSLVCLAPSAHAMIVVSADTTPAFYLTDAAPSNASAGNQLFFQRLLGEGDRVGVTDSLASEEIEDFYASLDGVEASPVLGTIGSAGLSGIDLLLVPLPEDRFSAGEISAIDSFVTGGGSLFLLGEAASLGGPSNGFLNELLAGLGLSISIDGSSLDLGAQVASGGQIAPLGLTSGISSFNYGLTAQVIGGTPIFRTSGNEAFMALVGDDPGGGNGGTTPEPGALALLSLGVLLLGARRAR